MLSRRTLILPVLFVVCVALFWLPTAQAQDETITNADQLVAVIDQSGLCYPLVSPTESPLSWQALGIFWADFNQLTNAIGDVRNFDGQTQYGITVWRLRLTRAADETVFSNPAVDTNLLQIAVTEDGFSNHYDRVLWTWCILAAVRNFESYDDLVADGYTFLNPKRIVLDIWLADINDCTTYDDNVASLNSVALGLSTGGFMMMDDDELPPSGGSDPCSITNLMQPFYITGITNGTNGTTITWPSCPMFRYCVSTADQLSTNTPWVSRSYTSYIWGQPNASTTSWTDPSTTNNDGSTVTQRFYRVQRLLGKPIAAGSYHSLAVLTNDALWAWGGDDQSQLGDNSTEPEAAPIPLTDPLCGPARLTNAVTLAAGYYYSAAVDANGMVWTWGSNDSGQLGNGAGPVSTPTPTPTAISGISNVVSVACGDDHTLALRADGTVWAWGDDSVGQLGVGSLPSPFLTNSPVELSVLTQIVAIAAGSQHSMALDTQGKVWTWGNGVDGELGNGGTSSTNLPMLVAGISNVIAIAAGSDHSVALTADKTVWTWGGNGHGDLGRTGDPTTPGPVTNLTGVAAIAAGYQFTLAVTSNGQIYAWGSNSNGQLGTNADVFDHSLPFLVAGISNAVLVSAHSEGQHCLAVTVNQGTNQYYAWGANDEGEVGDGAADDDPVGVQSNDNQITPTRLHFDDACTTCVQLGTSGTFTAQYTGTLRLYFNDTLGGAYYNNSGMYTAKVFAVGVTNATNVVVMANNGQGVSVGIVTKGSNYNYAASGYCKWDPTKGFVDANGVFSNNNTSADCSGFSAVGFCPNAQCFSLVGRIQ